MQAAAAATHNRYQREGMASLVSAQHCAPALTLPASRRPAAKLPATEGTLGIVPAHCSGPERLIAVPASEQQAYKQCHKTLSGGK